MKTIIITFQNKGKKESLITPLSHYIGIEMYYKKLSKSEFTKFLSELYSHRGKVENWVVVDNCQIIM